MAGDAMAEEPMNWRIVLGYAVFSIETNDAFVVTDAAPIGRWMIGKRLTEIIYWVKKKGGKIETLPHHLMHTQPELESEK